MSQPDTLTDLRGALDTAIRLQAKYEAALANAKLLQLSLARRLVLDMAGGHMSVHDCTIAVNTLLRQVGSRERVTLAQMSQLGTQLSSAADPTTLATQEEA
jgi:hypothetical protein